MTEPTGSSANDKRMLDLESGVQLVLTRVGDQLLLSIGERSAVSLTRVEAWTLSELLDEIATQR